MRCPAGISAEFSPARMGGARSGGNPAIPAFHHPRGHRKAGLTAADVHAVGIANQRETAPIWERKSGREEIATLGKVDRVSEPTRDDAWREARLAEWLEAVARVRI